MGSSAWCILDGVEHPRADGHAQVDWPHQDLPVVFADSTSARLDAVKGAGTGVVLAGTGMAMGGLFCWLGVLVAVLAIAWAWRVWRQRTVLDAAGLHLRGVRGDRLVAPGTPGVDFRCSAPLGYDSDEHCVEVRLDDEWVRCPASESGLGLTREAAARMGRCWQALSSAPAVAAAPSFEVYRGGASVAGTVPAVLTTFEPYPRPGAVDRLRRRRGATSEPRGRRPL